MSRYGAHSGTCDQILLSVRRFFSENCRLVSVRRPLWREVGSVFCHYQSIVTNQYLHQAFTLPSKSKLLYDWQSVNMSVIEHPCGTWDQILFPVGMLLSAICGLVSMGCHLWREDESAICSVIIQWSESLRTRTILYCLIWDSPNLEGEVPVFTSPRNKVAQL
jgi:hypothetical protein